MGQTSFPLRAITRSGATDGQFAKWDNALGRWVAATIPPTTPGGSVGQVQVHGVGGAFSGLSGSSVSGANLTLGGTLAATSLTASGLTSGRIPFVSTGGLLADSSTFVRDASTGFFGIGTPLPSQLLQVMGGNIYTNGEIYTDSSVWSDYLQSRNVNAITIKGRSLDGASAVSVVVDSVNALSTAGAKLLSIRNYATEKAYIDKDGGAYFAGKILSGDDPFNAFNQYAHALYWNGVGAIYSSAIFLELDSTSHNQSRAISVWDKRTSTGNQPSIGVVSPNGENIFGLTWDGGNTVGIVNTFGAQDIAFAPNNTTAVTIKNGGNVGFGTTDPSALIHGIKTTEQLRLGYDASNYYSTTVGSAGAVTIDSVGSGSSTFTFRSMSSTSTLRERANWNFASIDNTDATRKYRAILSAYDTAAREVLRGWADGSAGRLAVAAPASAPTDAHLAASQISFYLDETGHNLLVRAKYADGTTLKLATIALA